MNDDDLGPVEEGTPLDKLRAAVQEYAVAAEGAPVLVDVAVVLWEQVRYRDDGVIGRRIRYAIPTDNWALSAGIGLASAGVTLLRRDAGLGERGDES